MGAVVATLKHLAEVLHDHGACDRATCPFCVPGVHGGLSSSDAPAPALASPGDADLDFELHAHTLQVLREHGEDAIADALEFIEGWKP